MTDRPPTFNELLIQEVQRHPELYDQHHRVCTDNEERNMIWDAIAARIDDNVSGEFAKKRWLQMRDRYRKELKTALRSLTQPKWPYFEKLSWLDPYLKDARNGSTPLSSFTLGERATATSTPDISEVFHREDFLDFGFGTGISTNALLENIMAVSSKVFDQQNLNADFSPDSAIASTSDDGERQSRSNETRSPNLDDTGSECGFGSNFNQSVKSENSDHTESNEKPGTSQMNLNEGSLIDPKFLSSQLLEMASSAMHESTNLASNPFGNRLSPTKTRNRNHNPPYLVRRGGGIKVKPTKTEKETSVSLGTSKTDKLSMESAKIELNLLHKDSSCSNTSDEWQGEKWASDEDMLFARLIVVRLRKFNGHDKRVLKSRISELIDEKEEEVEKFKHLVSTPKN